MLSARAYAPAARRRRRPSRCRPSRTRPAVSRCGSRRPVRRASRRVVRLRLSRSRRSRLRRRARRAGVFRLAWPWLRSSFWGRRSRSSSRARARTASRAPAHGDPAPVRVRPRTGRAAGAPGAPDEPAAGPRLKARRRLARKRPVACARRRSARGRQPSIPRTSPPPTPPMRWRALSSSGRFERRRWLGPHVEPVAAGEA